MGSLLGGIFADGIFVDGIFVRWDFFRWDFCQVGFLASGIFAGGIFVRWDFGKWDFFSGIVVVGFCRWELVTESIDSPSACHLRRSQHKKWKVLIRVENSQWPLAGQKNTN